MNRWRAVTLDTADGLFTAFFSNLGLARLTFPDETRRTGRPELPALPPEQPLPSEWVKVTHAALRAVLAGQEPPMLPPLDWSGQTGFRQRVWKALLRIRPGQRKTYAEIAAELDQPRATRAVGGACGANPIPVLVPCHRVVAAHGGLGGFSAGLDWKRRLLAREGWK